MQFYPAIDVQGGRVARAAGDASPRDAARTLAAAGVAWAHVVDLDRAHGRGRNDATVRDVIAALEGVRVQLGGGLVEPDDVHEALGWGVERVVLGPGAVGRLPELAERFGADRLGLAVGQEGDRTSPLSGTERGAGGEEDPVARAVTSGITTIVYRDLSRDGRLGGANFDVAARWLGRGADVVLAGGVASLDELRQARAMGFAGVIVGTALLTGRFTLAEALRCCG